MRGFVLMVAASMLSGCSLLVQFDPETQPCDSAGACLAGYACVLVNDAGVCRSTDGGTVDAGASDSGVMCAARETNCGDGRDDDCDGQTDCIDVDCANLGCNDGNPCSTGETCSSGACRGGSQVICNSPPNSCQAQNGSCDLATGRCLYSSLPDGTLCGAAPSSRCCSGNCKNTTLIGTDCGGCGLACATGQVCQPINQSACGVEPIDTSGRCSCNSTAPCPRGQTCASNGYCKPLTPTECAPGQSVGDGGLTCETYCRY